MRERFKICSDFWNFYTDFFKSFWTPVPPPFTSPRTYFFAVNGKGFQPYVPTFKVAPLSEHLPKIENLTAVPGSNPGEVDIAWTPWALGSRYKFTYAYSRHLTWFTSPAPTVISMDAGAATVTLPLTGRYYTVYSVPYDVELAIPGNGYPLGVTTG